MASERIRSWIDRMLAAAGPLELLGAMDAIERAFGPDDVGELADLIEMLGHPDARARFGAALAIGSIGPGAGTAVPRLLRSLRDPDGQVRHDAATALGRIDARRPDVIKGLFRLRFDEDDDVEAAAEEALDRLLRDYAGPDAEKFRRRFGAWRA
jgi:HEAT repeat protein